MKKYISTIMVILFGSVMVFAQESQELSKKELRKLKKEQRQEERINNLELYSQVARERQWVLETHTIFNKYGRSFQMDPTINFVSMNDDESIIQLGFHGLIGYNGLGGITLQGNVSDYEVTRDEQSVVIRFMALGSGMGPVDVLARINPDGYGRLTVRGNWGRRLTFAGYFLPYENSRTFTGNPVY